jgi:L-gulono-1,4-lactone dehydrogenase
VPAGTDHTTFFGGLEPILREAGRRPHRGKVHTRTAADPALRDRLDPDRVFANEHLRRILGD